MTDDTQLREVCDDIISDLVWNNAGALVDNNKFWLEFFESIWKDHPELREELDAHLAETRVTPQPLKDDLGFR
jgi:hypothetical protein